jgi:hypothetical protein
MTNHTPTLSLEEILETIAAMEYASEEKIEQFALQLKNEGLNDSTLSLFSELVTEEIAGRDADIEIAQKYLGSIERELEENEPKAQEEMQKMDEQIDGIFTAIEEEANEVYATIAHDAFEAINAEQAEKDQEKIIALKKSVGI